MKVVWSVDHRFQNPKWELELGERIPTYERAERADRIHEVLRADGRFEIVGPSAHGREPIEHVHAHGLIDFLERGWGELHARFQREEFVPEVMLHPGLRDGMSPIGAPDPVMAAFGYWCYETATPLVQGTYTAARASVDVALSAADLVLAGERSAYGLCRPPGHHAARSVFGGFCYFNNAAIVADHLARSTGSRVAVLDVDYHHGNGTQQIFYDRDDVVFVSLHGDPERAYPWFAGFADEKGTGKGQGFNLNVPLKQGTDDDAYLSALTGACADIMRTAPDLLVVSLGVDTYWNDPISDFALTEAGYTRAGDLVRSLGIPTVIVQEGGYDIDAIGGNVRAWLEPFTH
jgi:acetoin utilization deacetylase AcuC-like enzyme